MTDLLIHKINEKNSTPLSLGEVESVKKALKPKRLLKRQYLLQEGDVCKYMAFVDKGTLRSFMVDDKGNEHILQFALEGWIIADLYSYLTGEPARLNIEALENSDLLLIDLESQERLLKEIPKVLTYFYYLMQSAYVALQKRHIGKLSLSIEENYSNLIKSYPDIIQRVPQHMIASYLGITPETLSRVKKQMFSKIIPLI